MSSYRRSEIVSGLFVTLAAVVFALFAFKVGRFDLMGLLKDKAITCRTYFANVKTLQAGSKVRVGTRIIAAPEAAQIRLAANGASRCPIITYGIWELPEKKIVGTS